MATDAGHGTPNGKSPELGCKSGSLSNSKLEKLSSSSEADDNAGPRILGLFVERSCSIQILGIEKCVSEGGGSENAKAYLDAKLWLVGQTTPNSREIWPS